MSRQTAKFLILQIIGIGLLTPAYIQGWLDEPFDGPNMIPCGLIAVLFGIGLLAGLFGRWHDAMTIEANMPFAALIATVYGIIQALVAAKVLEGGDPQSALPFMSGVLTGVGIAMWATLVGLVGRAWLLLTRRVVLGIGE